MNTKQFCDGVRENLIIGQIKCDLQKLPYWNVKQIAEDIFAVDQIGDIDISHLSYEIYRKWFPDWQPPVDPC